MIQSSHCFGHLAAKVVVTECSLALWIVVWLPSPFHPQDKLGSDNSGNSAENKPAGLIESSFLFRDAHNVILWMDNIELCLRFMRVVYS